MIDDWNLQLHSTDQYFWELQGQRPCENRHDTRPEECLG